MKPASDNENSESVKKLADADLPVEIEKLRSQEHMTQGLIDSIPESLMLLDRNGVVLAANETLARRLKMPLDRLKGACIFDVLDPGVAWFRRAKMDEVLLKGKQLSFEDITHGRIIQSTVNPVFSEDGQLSRIAVIARDVTELRQTEAALRAGEEEYRYIVEHAPTAIYEIDLMGRRFIRVNDAVCLALGYTREELLAMEPSALLDEGTKAVFRERITRVLAGEKFDESVIYGIVGKGGRKIYASLNTRVLKGDGKPDSVLVIAQDITERKLADERQAFLLRLSDALRPLADLSDIQLTASTLLGMHVNADRVHYGEYHDDEGFIVISSSYIREGIKCRPQRLSITDLGEVAAVLRSGRTAAIGNTETSPMLSERARATYRALGSSSFVSVPLVREGKLVLTLTVISNTPRDWTPDEIALIEEVHARTWAAVEHARAEKELRESETRFKSVLDNSRDCIYRMSVQTGRYEYISPSCKDIVGYTPDELMALDVEASLAMVHPDDLPALRAAVVRCIETGNGKAEYRQRTKSGDLRWISNHMIIIRDGNGRPIYRDGSQRDITERKLAEMKVRLHKKVLEGINRIFREAMTSDTEEELGETCLGVAEEITQSKFGFICEINDEGRLNDIAINDSGYDACRTANLIGHRVVPAGFKVHGLYGQVLRDGKPFYTNDPSLHLDSTRIPAGHPPLTALLGVPLMQYGKVIGMVGVGNKEGGYNDEDIIVLNAVAPAMVEALQRKRMEADMQEAKIQAELYLDLMGHDINNLHQVALGYLELVQDMHPDIEENELLEKPIEVLQRSSRLIKNVQKLQKHRHGIYKTEKMDLLSVLQSVQKEFGGVPGKTIYINLNGLEQCHVQANELLHDIFANLVSNAVRHTGDKAEIIIDVDRVSDGRFYRVIVEDDGPGVADGFKDSIFNRMQKGSAKGMGLGLYLVKTLVDSFGGRVWVEDRVLGDYAKGARFVVLLPAI